MKSKIEVGMRFGSLVVKERDYSKSSKNAYWICECDCGKIVSKAAQGLNNGQSTCCDRYKCPYRKQLGKDLTGQRFERLVALHATDKRINNSVVWVFQCDCGNIKELPSSSVTSGKVKSCGCLKAETDRQTKNTWINLTGQKFGHLTAIKRVESDKYGHARWECECDCGNPEHLIVTGDNLRRGHTQSCGCDRRSHGEIKISQLLNENSIPYVQEYKPFKFASKNWASYDFYVNNKYIVEYDGETHYKANLHGWHTEEQLKAQQERDIIKNQWCEDNNIPLIRIPYWRLKDLCIEDLLLETSEYIINK